MKIPLPSQSLASALAGSILASSALAQSDTAGGLFAEKKILRSTTSGSLADGSSLQAGGIDLGTGLPQIPLNVGSPLTFNFTKGAGILALEAGTPAQQAQAAAVVAGFTAAGDLWRAAFVDPITINVTIDYQALGAGILGSTSTATFGATYGSTRLSLLADAKSANDGTATLSLPNVAARTFFTNDRAGVKFLDSDGSANNSVLDISRANGKAIGLIGANDVTSDGAITFSSNFSFDFNRGDGINGAQYDFIGVAAHEIGHLMGFVSGVDTVDYFTGAGPGAGTDLNGASAGIGTLDPFRVFNVLDLYRYSAQAVGQGAGVLDLATGGTSYFSINGGAGNLGTFSTGSYNGDGRQASHWKDNLALGIMDPTLANGELALIRTLDLTALDVIGYDIAPIPELSSFAFGAVVFIAGFARSRRRTRVVSPQLG